MVSGCQEDVFTVSCMVPSISLVLAAVAAALLICSLSCALLAAHPSKIHNDPPPEFFLLSHIARTKRQAFIKAYEEASYSDLVEEALIAIHGKARYANRKFRWLMRAVQTTLLSLGFIVLTLLVAVASRAFA